MAGIDEKWAADVNSPVKKPVAGCLVRISPDGRRRQVVADGFRNAYDFDWNSVGDPFTFFERPLSGSILAIAALVVLLPPLYRAIKAYRRPAHLSA